MLGKDVEHRAQYNTNNHFMYAMAPKRNDRRRRAKLRRDDKSEQDNNEPRIDSEGRIAAAQRDDLKPQDLRMTYDEWLEKANKTHVDAEDEHYYFRLIGCGYMGTTGDCDRGSSE